MMEPYNASSTPCRSALIEARPLWQESNPRVSRRTARRLCEAAAFAAAAPSRCRLASCMPRRGVRRTWQSAMYLSHVAFELPLGEVGRAFGRDRTTAAHACRLIEDRRDDPAVDAVLAALENACRALRRRLGAPVLS